MTNYIFYGLVTSAASFVYTLVLYFLGYHGEKMEQGALLGWLGMVILIIGLILSIKEAKKDALEESKAFGYGGAFKAGFLTTVFIALGSLVFTYIYFAFINTDMADYVIAQQQQEMIEQGQPDEVIEQVEGATRTMMQPGIQAVIGLFGSLLMGTILSLILAIFLKQKPGESAPQAG